MNIKHLISMVLIAAITLFTIHVLYMKTESARLDFTQTNLYSLTPGTKDILQRMKKEGVKPVDIKLYFSETTGKSLPRFIKNFITYENYLANLLKEYARESDGKIQVSFIDPLPDSDEAQDATDYGLDGKPINQDGDLFFFGLVFQTQTGSKDVIDFLWPEKQESVEYEISKKMYNLVWPTKKKIGVLSGINPLPDDNPYMAQLLAAQGKQPEEPWISMELLKEHYDVTRIDKDSAELSKDDYDLLLVIHPRDFGDKQLWLLNQWIVTGGRAIVFLDPYSIADQAPQNPQQPWAQLQYRPSSNLTKLMDVWGISRAEDQFIVDPELGVRRPVDRRGGVELVMTDLGYDAADMADTLDLDSPIFQGLETLRFFLAGSLEKTEGDHQLEIKPLITTSEAAGTLTIKPGFGGQGELAYTDLQAAGKLRAAYSPQGKKVLAYMLNGQFPDAFPQGASFAAKAPEPPPGMPPGFQMPPDENAEMITKEALSSEQYATSSVMVFADVDFITDQLAFQRSFFGVAAANDNHKVLLNSVDYLVGAEELMKVRVKKNISRPFKKFQEIEARADRDLLDEERGIRNEIEVFQQELQDKQRGINQNNAVLFQKKLQDEIATLNDKISDGNRKLREIRKVKRAEIDRQETIVRASIMWLMPILVCLGGFVVLLSRKQARNSARKG